MKRRTRIQCTDSHKALMRDRWQQDESLHQRRMPSAISSAEQAHTPWDFRYESRADASIPSRTF